MTEYFIYRPFQPQSCKAVLAGVEICLACDGSTSLRVNPRDMELSAEIAGRNIELKSVSLHLLQSAAKSNMKPASLVAVFQHSLDILSVFPDIKQYLTTLVAQQPSVSIKFGQGNLFAFFQFDIDEAFLLDINIHRLFIPAPR